MRRYTTLSNGQDTVQIKKGWAWVGWFFNIFWLMVKGLWIQLFVMVGIAIGLVAVSIHFGLTDEEITGLGGLYNIFTSFVILFKGNGWLVEKYRSDGYRDVITTFQQPTQQFQQPIQMQQPIAPMQSTVVQ
jgi:hypothetical protein